MSGEIVLYYKNCISNFESNIRIKLLFDTIIGLICDWACVSTAHCTYSHVAQSVQRSTANEPSTTCIMHHSGSKSQTAVPAFAPRLPTTRKSSLMHTYYSNHISEFGFITVNCITISYSPLLMYLQYEARSCGLQVKSQIL